MADKGYDFDDIRLSAQRRGYVAHIPHRGVAPSKRRRGQKAHRWVIERTNRWHNLFRRLKIRYEVHARNYLAFVELANAIICFRGQEQQDEVYGRTLNHLSFPLLFTAHERTIQCRRKHAATRRFSRRC